MQRFLQRARGSWAWAFAASFILIAGGVAYADDTRHASTASSDELWRRSISLVSQGDFSRAVETIRRVPAGTGLTDKVRTWLEAYEAKQAARRELDRADFEKYVRYAKERIERKEYTLALDRAFLAADVAEDREAFLQSDWLQQLVKDALTKAEEFRREADWRGAWRIYNYLTALYENEPGYEKLEHEVQTHWRLDAMFEEDNHWDEHLEKVRWEDAETALQCIGMYYVEPADFKAICKSGLEQLLILADSKSAQEVFKGLADENDRHDFKARVEAKLDQVRASPTLTRRDCVQHFRRVVEDINRQTVRLPEELLVSELMRGALEPLDDYTTIIWPRDSEEFDKHTRGDFIGIGISIIRNNMLEIEVVTPLDDTPAYRAGIQAGDIVVAVDGERVKGESLNKVVDIITGPKREGTEVILTVRRGDEEIDFPLRREVIKIRSVKGVSRDHNAEERWNHWINEEDRIGYIRITNFQKNTVEDVANVMSNLEAEGLKGLILDLRGNPGGLLDSAYGISAMFLRTGDIVVTTKGRDPLENRNFPTRVDGLFLDVPIVVLTDEGSASASEIVAGAIRDNGRGTVVGARTFGKFSVQNLIPLSRSRAKLKITTARYYLPSGVSLHREPNSDTWGVEPSVPVRLVRKEMINIYRMRRDADLLGPPKPEAPATDEDGEKKDADEAEDAEANDAAGDKETAAADDKDEKPTDDELPPLDQPDENDRPKEDPQLDTALLLMRVKLLGTAYPTLATAAADRAAQREVVRP